MQNLVLVPGLASDSTVWRRTILELKGEVTAAANPNGSLENIAGLLSEGRNVLGMMPHPDRSSEELLGSADGLLLFQSMVQSLAAAQ